MHTKAVLSLTTNSKENLDLFTNFNSATCVCSADFVPKKCSKLVSYYLYYVQFLIHCTTPRIHTKKWINYVRIDALNQIKQKWYLAFGMTIPGGR